MRKRLESAITDTLDDKATKLKLVPASLGVYLNGQKTIVVADKPDYIWCRVRGQTSQMTQAFNAHSGGVAHHWDLPILIYRDPAYPDIWKVYGRDIRRYKNWEGISYIVPHGLSHSLAGSGKVGDDPVWIDRRQILPLQPHPAPSGTMGIEIASDFYYFGGLYHWFAGTGTADLSGYKPTGALNGMFVTVYIDGDKEIAYLAGDEFGLVIPPADPGPFIPIPRPDQGVPVCAVLLSTGTAMISWGDMYDLRFIQEPAPSSGSSIYIYDEGLIQGVVDSMNFEGDTVQAIVSGSFAHIVHTGGATVGAQHFHVEEPTALATLTGGYWQVALEEYATGSLAVAVNGIVQTPSVNYQEQYPGSGTFEFLGDGIPTGSVVTCWYGVYCG